MECRKAQRYVQDLADGCLTGSVSLELQRHLSECTDCRVAQQRATRLQQVFSVKRHETPRPEYFDSFIAEFHSRLAQPPPRTWWNQVVESLHFPALPAFRYGFAPVCGLLVACTMILRSVVSTGIESEGARVGLVNFASPHLSVGSLPAPHSTPRAIASILPRAPEPTSAAGSALILPVAPRGELSTPRYVLDRISLSPASYEVASIHF